MIFSNATNTASLTIILLQTERVVAVLKTLVLWLENLQAHGELIIQYCDIISLD